MKRKGFTIVELMAVVAILSVLITITVSAISGSLKRARAQRADAVCTLVQQGIATYYAQKDEWPVEPGNQDSTSGIYVYTSSEVREMVKKLIEMTRDDNPVMDVSGLYVSTTSGEADSRGHGMDFLTAIHGSRANSKKLKVPQMYFGYPDEETGYFRRFKMYYTPATDSVTVTKQ